MTDSYNKFKSTTIYGNFINDTSGSYIASCNLKGNVIIGGNINLSNNSNIYKADGTLFVGQKGDTGLQGIQGKSLFIEHPCRTQKKGSH